jgi:hypothetical protein
MKKLLVIALASILLSGFELPTFSQRKKGGGGTSGGGGGSGSGHVSPTLCVGAIRCVITADDTKWDVS